MTLGSRTIPYGRFGRPHGLGGEIAVHPFNPGGFSLAELRFPLSVEVERDGQRAVHRLTSVRPAGVDLFVRVAGFVQREEVGALTNATLHVPREALPPLAPGEFYVQDLYGCAVFDLDGKPRGSVQGSLWNGAHDILSIVNEAGEELLIPTVGGFVQSFDEESRRLVIDPHE